MFLSWEPEANDLWEGWEAKDSIEFLWASLIVPNGDFWLTNKS